MSPEAGRELRMVGLHEHPLEGVDQPVGGAGDGIGFSPPARKRTFTATWRGNRVVGIDPPGRLLPLFVALLAANVLALAVWTGPRYWMQKNAARRAQAARAELDRQRQATVALREREGAALSAYLARF